MSIEAEQALIGCILVNNKAFEFVPEIEPHHFKDQAHVSIYAAMYRDLVKGKPVDAITVIQVLRKNQDDEACGGMPYLNQLMMGACSPKNVTRYAEIILERFRLDELKGVAFDVMAQLDERKDSIEIAGHVTSKLSNLTHKTSDIVSITDALAEHTDVMELRTEGKHSFTATGLTDLDKKLGGGFSGGDLVILAARPSMGKTMCSLTIALNVAEKKPVMFFSMEMTRSQLIDRAIANYGNVPIGWVRNPSKESNDPCWPAYTQASQRLAKLKLMIDDKPGRRMVDIVSIAKAQHRKNPLGLVVVDYLGLIRGGNAANRNLELGDYTKTLKELAKALDCPVMLLSQLNRGVEQRANKRPVMSDLRDSGEIEADADIVMMLYREEYYQPDTKYKGVCEIDIPKQRQGETGVVGVAFRGEYQRFDDLAHEFRRDDSPPPSKTRGLD